MKAQRRLDPAALKALKKESSPVHASSVVLFHASNERAVRNHFYQPALHRTLRPRTDERPMRNDGNLVHMISRLTLS
ncbi:unnamed protein product, partial [Amoebophrya sp. A25]|eukprot:GSA25T00015616001.1